MENENETSLGIGISWVQNQYSIKTFKKFQFFKPVVFPFLQPIVLMQI